MSWWQLANILQANAQEQAAYNALPPDACPFCGTPLQVGRQTEPGGGKLTIRHCPLGDYEWTGGTRLT